MADYQATVNPNAPLVGNPNAAGMALPTQLMPPENNPNTDSSNGAIGARTPGATASGQLGKPSGNPFADMIAHATALHATALGQPGATTTNTTGTTKSTLYTGADALGGGFFQPDVPGGGDPGSTGGGGPSTGTPETRNPGTGGTPTTPTLPDRTVPLPTTGPGRNRPSISNPAATRPKPPGMDDDTYKTLVDWTGKDPRYNYLWDRPDWVSSYKSDMYLRGDQNVDFVDWLQDKLKYMPVSDGKGGTRPMNEDELKNANPLYQRRGFDTWMYSSPGVLRGMNTPGNGIQGPNSDAAMHQQLMNDYLSGAKTYTDPNAPKPGAGAPGVTTPSPTLPGPPTVTSPANPLGGIPKPDLGSPIGTGNPRDLGFNGTPALSPDTGFTPGSTNTTTTGAPGDPRSTAGNPIEALLGPMYQKQQQDLKRGMDAEAAKTGDINSGGYGENRATAVSNLAGQQGGQLAQYTFQGQQAELDRAQKYYETNVSASIAQAGQRLQQYGIDINATMQQYGIDTDYKKSIFLANLDAETRRYQADKGLSAAQAAAQATTSAAGIAARASNQNAQLSYQLGLGGLDMQNQQSIMSFILGLYGLGNDQIKNLIGTSPDQLTGGAQIPGGTVVVRNP